MDKNTLLKLSAVAGTVALSVLAKMLLPPQPTSLFSFSEPTSTVIKIPSSPEIAKEKTAAVKNLLESEAFIKALPSMQKEMLKAITDLYN